MMSLAREEKARVAQDHEAASSPKRAGASLRVFVSLGETPRGVLHWSRDDHKQRREIMTRWRRSVIATFLTKAQPLRLAWALSEYMVSRGYAFVGNTRLGTELGMTPKKIDEAISSLKSTGAIVVVWVRLESGKQERRVYPASAVLKNDPLGDGWIGARRSQTSPSLGGSVDPDLPPYAGDKLHCSYPPTGGDGLSPDHGGSEEEKEKKALANPKLARLSALQNKSSGRSE